MEKNWTIPIACHSLSSTCCSTIYESGMRDFFNYVCQEEIKPR